MQTTTTAPSLMLHRASGVPRRVLAAVLLAAALVVAGAGPAVAKGPMPTAPDPVGPLVAGGQGVIEVRADWPGGIAPDNLGPEFYEQRWWSLLAVTGTATSPADLAAAAVLEVTHQGLGRYTAPFTPSVPGQWSLVIAYRDEGDGWRATETSTVAVAEPAAGDPARATLIGVGLVLAVVVVGAGAFTRTRRARSRRSG